MIADNNILTPLAFYTDKKYQDRYKSYGYGEIYPLFAPNNKILPFQFEVGFIYEVGVSYSNKLIYVRPDGTETTSVENLAINIDFITLGGRSYAVYNGIYTGQGFSTINEGRYYIEATYNKNDVSYKYYSEIFTVVNTLQPYLCLKWWDEENMVMDGGVLIYEGTSYNSRDYKNQLYLPTEVGKPAYEFEEEGEERNGYFFAEKQISKKRYQFNFLAPEYVCDALRLMRMHDYITIECNGITYYADQANVEVNWQTQGNLASVTVTFYCSTVAKKVGKMTPYLTGGDYNDDYNDDYNNEEP